VAREGGVNSVGRPSKYDPAFAGVAGKAAAAGLEDLEIAKVMEVGYRTFLRWKAEKPEFGSAIRLGRELARQSRLQKKTLTRRKETH